jgi:hypothetical protein
MGIVRIPLHSRKYPGLFALIDEEDYERVSKYRWSPYPANSACGGFYAATWFHVPGSPKPQTMRMHRFLLGAPPGVLVDHENHDGLDNRRCNIRLADRTQNAANARKKPSKSGFRGVGSVPRGGKWRASISVNNRIVRLGTFTTREEAARAYDAAARRIHGEFAILNFPDDHGDAVNAPTLPLWEEIGHA